MMDCVKRDLRPEGGVLPHATMYAAWSKALFIAQQTASAGHHVTIDAGSHNMIRGIPLQRIQVGI